MKAPAEINDTKALPSAITHSKTLTERHVRCSAASLQSGLCGCLRLFMSDFLDMFEVIVDPFNGVA
ncbi:hypothetical protein [Aquabacterium sp.]|uniref:hypothetical protein n=1 Tax=Aquabacterium sp. TaxID=1872578 RepID=UPI003BF5E466